MQLLSLVIPVYNEEQNVEHLFKNTSKALKDYHMDWECILVDDGSSDKTYSKMESLKENYTENFKLIQLQKNFGQTAAMQAGIDAAQGQVIATLDGDLQNDPNDIPAMVKRLIDEDLDLVVGWRKDRKDNLIYRKIPSMIANKLIGAITGIKIHDYGCSLKVYRASVIKAVRLYGEMHRFIPAWATTVTSPNKIKEQVVNHYARQYGVSKYGISRTFRVLLDLISVFFFIRFKARPGHFFGFIGMVMGLAGTATLGYLVSLKIILGENIGGRPLLLLGILLIISAFQFITTGIISEFMARTYFESGNNLSYTVREKI